MASVLLPMISRSRGHIDAYSLLDQFRLRLEHSLEDVQALIPTVTGRLFSAEYYTRAAPRLSQSRPAYLSSVFFMKTLAHFVLTDTDILTGTTSEESRSQRLELHPSAEACPSNASLTLASLLGSLASPRPIPHQRSPA